MALQVIGAGLSRTGACSLHAALGILGLYSLHFDNRLRDVLDGSTTNPSFRRYEGVGAVFDIPAALFYRELLEAYPEAKVILTMREIDSWWKSIEYHFNVRVPIPNRGDYQDRGHGIPIQEAIHGTCPAGDGRRAAGAVAGDGHHCGRRLGRAVPVFGAAGAG